jgi:hypothetical protein
MTKKVASAQATAATTAIGPNHSRQDLFLGAAGGSGA